MKPTITDKLLVLNLPAREKYELYKKKYRYNDKEYFVRYSRPLLHWLKLYEKVEWQGDDDKVRSDVEQALAEYNFRREVARKDVFETIYAAFYASSANMSLYFRDNLTGKSLDLARQIVSTGAVTVRSLFNEAGVKDVRYDTFRYLPLQQKQLWTSSPILAPISAGCFMLNGNIESNESWWTTTGTYAIPEAYLCEYIYSLDGGVLRQVAEPAEEHDGILLPFADMSFMSIVETIRGLIEGKVVVPTQSKVGVSAIKKLQATVNLEPFPAESVCILPRAAYVANLAIATYGTPGEDFYPNASKTNEGFLRAIFRAVGSPMKCFLADVLRDRVRLNVGDLRYYHSQEIENLFTSICNTLRSSESWVDTNSLYNVAHHAYFATNIGYIMPMDEEERPQKVKLPSDAYMVMSQFKRNIHDVIFRSMVEAFAAIGGLELLFDSVGNIKYVRPTPLGRWYLGQADALPTVEADVTLAQALEVDQSTGMVLVRDAAYPYLSILAELAEKLTDTRYVITEKSLLSRCTDIAEFKARIDKLKRFVVPEPTERIQAIIEAVMGRYNSVVPTRGGSLYKLYDINPADSRLQELISTNAEIRENTLRVEGFKLLVKTAFIPRLTHILASAGYL